MTLSEGFYAMAAGSLIGSMLGQLIVRAIDWYRSRR
jgi:hypothetical protein